MSKPVSLGVLGDTDTSNLYLVVSQSLGHLQLILRTKEIRLVKDTYIYVIEFIHLVVPLTLDRHFNPS